MGLLRESDQGRISPYKFLAPCLSVRIEFTNQQTNEKSRTFRATHGFLSYLLLKEVNIHINLIRFDYNLDHPYINIVHQPLSPENSPKNHNFFHKVKKRSISTCCKLCRQFLVKIACFFWKNCHLIVLSLTN